ncbi:golgi-associated kinase 1a [Anaeramoeba flamelloides]|uniref:Golgi-associated kinase 1a n=1 Tax=Anaeramoeba flamelloides TaxID=1746091 RepID=A0ABQ8ZDV7_9EUKA|nr:golgi-associated kinase 1a [Anaeramoeba flamelloides]
MEKLLEGKNIDLYDLFILTQAQNTLFEQIDSNETQTKEREIEIQETKKQIKKTKIEIKEIEIEIKEKEREIKVKQIKIEKEKQKEIEIQKKFTNLTLKDERHIRDSNFKSSSENSQNKGTTSKNASSSTCNVPTDRPIPLGQINNYFQKFDLKIIEKILNSFYNQNQNQNQNNNSEKKNNQNQNQNKNKNKIDKSNQIFKNIERLNEISNGKYKNEKDFQIKLMKYFKNFEKDLGDLRFLCTGEIQQRAFYNDKPDFLIVDKSGKLLNFKFFSKWLIPLKYIGCRYLITSLRVGCMVRVG